MHNDDALKSCESQRAEREGERAERTEIAERERESEGERERPERAERDRET